MATECQVREEVGERVVEEWNIREFGGIEWVNERKGKRHIVGAKEYIP